LKTEGYIQSKNDYSLFLKKADGHLTAVAVYVDDLLVTGSNPTTVEQLKHQIHLTFGIKDLGLLHYFLGIEATSVKGGILLSQKKFATDLLTDTGFLHSKATSTPLPLHFNLNKDSGTLLSDPSYYRMLVGKLNYLTNTRPDLAYTAQTLSQFMQLPHTSHLQALEHVLKYIKGTVSHGLLIQGSNQVVLQAYSDSDWAACSSTRRSITGYVLMLGKSAVSWKSKKQSTVSKSSAESEYRAMSQAASEVTWLVRLLEELQIKHITPVTLYCDNQSALHIAKNPIFHERTKHIEIDCHFTRDKVLEGLLQLSYLPTTHQLADVFTKILPSNQHWFLLHKLGLFSPHSSLRGGVGGKEISTSRSSSATSRSAI